ncbi:MAG: response regulator transcription factor [Clostridia bacterium]|nr:response regulator transcription factor [Clostridia bacterium]
MKKTILVIDDDVRISDMLNEILSRAGYGVIRAYSGTEALLVLEKSRPDLALLDLMLPGMSGEDVLAGIRGVPVIVLSAKADVQDKVDLLLGGAADYMTKPFDTRELLARIEVQLRKRNEQSQEVYTFEDLSVDTLSHAVEAAGVNVALTKTEYAILKLLMINQGRVLAKSVILDRISADTPDCTESSLKTHISHLRRKLREAGGREYIESVWGIGFKLHASTLSQPSP